MDRKRQGALLIALGIAALAWRCYRAFVTHCSWEHIYEGTDTRFDSILAGCVLTILANPRLGDRVEWLTKNASRLAVGGAILIVLCFAYRNPLLRNPFSLHASGDRTVSDFLSCHIVGAEPCDPMPGVACSPAPGSAFVQHVLDSPHAVSSLLSAECDAGRWDLCFDSGVRT